MLTKKIVFNKYIKSVSDLLGSSDVANVTITDAGSCSAIASWSFFERDVPVKHKKARTLASSIHFLKSLSRRLGNFCWKAMNQASRFKASSLMTKSRKFECPVIKSCPILCFWHFALHNSSPVHRYWKHFHLMMKGWFRMPWHANGLLLTTRMTLPHLHVRASTSLLVIVLHYLFSTT